ncbi:MAG: hypothetical protein F3743_08690 [Nitrospinae bacterium]|nr:hypothetical protein [Nitrospinota bacterium]
MMGVFFKKYPGKIIISAVAYFLAGETVFSLPIGAESASAFFVPSGVALAAIAFWVRVSGREFFWDLSLLTSLVFLTKKVSIIGKVNLLYLR